MKRLIVTGDDFGLAPPVNEAIVAAHRNGILTTASLMVGAPAAADAIERARCLPTLKIGLHLTIVEGYPILPCDQVPDLVNSHGEFSRQLVRTGFRFLLRPAVKGQLEAEIRAQFQAFSKTGLLMDHVDTHNHMHLHPLLLGIILKVGQDFGLKAMRYPCEPPFLSWKATGKGFLSGPLWWIFLWPWTRLMRRRFHQLGIRCNDHLLGMMDSGRMTKERVLGFLRHLPEGITEMHFHPATRRCPEIDRTMPDYRHQAELQALTSPEVSTALHRLGIQRISFCDIE